MIEPNFGGDSQRFDRNINFRDEKNVMNSSHCKQNRQNRSLLGQNDSCFSTAKGGQDVD